MAGESFLSPQDIAQLHTLMDDGNATVEAFQRPAPVVQFRRMNTDTGRLENVGDPVQLISITFGLREGKDTDMGALQQTFADGDIRLWADGFRPKVDDRFTFDGMTIEVVKVFPENQGTVTAEVRVQQVNR